MRTKGMTVAAVLLPLVLALPMGPPPPEAGALAGSVRTAEGRALGGLDVAVEDMFGRVVARTTTRGSGRFRIVAPVGSGALVVESGARPPAPSPDSVGLPVWFRWRLPVSVPPIGDRELDLRLPPARAVSVTATDAAGRPMAAVSVIGGARRAVDPVPLWPGGPIATGSQVVVPPSVPTGFDGQARMWAFGARDLGPLQIGQGAVRRAGGRVNVAETSTGNGQVVVAVPQQPACLPSTAPDLGARPVDLVSDLDEVTPRPSAWRQPLLEMADRIVTGSVPPVAYTGPDPSGDPVRYLFDESVALRRITGVLGYAYAATGQARYLDALAEQVARNAAAWPDWNPAHPLDTAQVATAVALAYSWSGPRMSAAERSVVADALVTRMVMPYSCADGVFAGIRSLSGNRATVVASAAVLAGLAVRADAPSWASVAVADGTAALAQAGADDGTGRSVASGPTVEGLMYTTYEAAALALVHATRWRNLDDPAVTAALTGPPADLGRLAEWTERCGAAADPAMEDGWDRYPWVDRTTALAAMTAWPGAGTHTLGLLDALQAADVLAVPGAGSWPVPDGIAELIVSDLEPVTASSAPPADVHVSGSGPAAYWGCVSNAPLRAVLSAAPSDAPHAHRDVGNVVVSNGDQPLLADLGQRDYRLTGVPYVWRADARAHSTVGVVEADGRVTQARTGRGTVAVAYGSLAMDTSTAIPGVDWRRTVTLATDTVTIHDRLLPRTAVAPGPGTALALSFLVATPPSSVTAQPGGVLLLGMPDGTSWALTAPAGTVPTFRDATPVSPYGDAEDVWRERGPAHALVTVPVTLGPGLDLVTSLRRLGG